MTKEYEYNAPMFGLLGDPSFDDNDDRDVFFDTISETPRKPGIRKLSGIKESEEVLDVSNKENISPKHGSSKSINRKKTFDGISLLETSVETKKHSMVTRQDVAKMIPECSVKLRSRNVLKENLKWTKKVFSSNNSNTNEFKSAAELAYHFQKDTPPRFRTVSNTTSGHKKAIMKTGLESEIANQKKRKLTIPESPMLLSKKRARASNILPYEQREVQAIAEARKQHPIKATKLNQKVFEPPCPIKREHQFTVPQPFNLSRSQYKTKAPKEEVFVFKAQPLPKSVSRLSGMPSRRNSRPSQYSSTSDGESLRGLKEGQFKRTTQVKPFSFDSRNSAILQRKKERINKILAEEKSARQFKAQPLPPYLSAHKH